MILVSHEKGSWELQSLIQKQGISCEKTPLPYADACFEGNGPDGIVGVGVERKRIGDMLNCINDGRYTGHQRIGMKQMYRFSFLVIEGIWRPDVQSGVLLEGHQKPDGKIYWASDRGYGTRKIMYRTLRRYLFSVSLSGVIVMFTRDIAHTCYDIVELYHWFQKAWRDHKALQAMHLGGFWERDGATRDLMAIPTLDRKPSLVRLWAKDIDGIGVKYSQDAERIFKTPRDLANGDELDWIKIEGVGVHTAQSVVRQIGGRR